MAGGRLTSDSPADSGAPCSVTNLPTEALPLVVLALTVSLLLTVAAKPLARGGYCRRSHRGLRDSEGGARAERRRRRRRKKARVHRRGVRKGVLGRVRESSCVIEGKGGRGRLLRP